MVILSGWKNSVIKAENFGDGIMTLKKLSELTGVSVSTISKAFAESSEISEKTKKIIFDTAKSEGCFEKYYKGKYNKKVIAIICPEINSEFYSRKIAVLERLAGEMGAIAVVSVSNFDTNREKELFEYHSFLQKADGIILIGSGVEIVDSRDVPAVAIGASDKMKNIDCIGSDLETAVSDAVKYLKENGHRKIGFAGEGKTRGKFELVKRMLEEYGLEIEDKNVFIRKKRFEDAGYECGMQIIKKSADITAVFAAYDYIAIGIIDCLTKHGIKVPQDISVIGMDDISAASYGGIELTSINDPVEKQCSEAIELLKKKMDNKYAYSKKKIVIKSELVKRKTVCRAKTIK